MSAAETFAPSLSHAPAGKGARSNWLWQPGGFFAVLTLFAVCHWLLRPWLTATAGSDDTDQLLLSQVLLPGYAGLQQPLYTWLLWAVSQLAGPTILAAAFVKYGAVFLIHTFAYLCGRRLIDDPRLHFVAGFTPLLIYPLAWRLHEADTQGVLACALVLALYWTVLRLGSRRGWGGFVLLGIVAGLGLLTTLAFLAGIVALLLAAALAPTPRPLVADRRILLSGLIALALFTPHLAWMVEHWAGVTREFDIYLRGVMRLDYGRRLATGLPDWFYAAVISMFPLWLIVPLLFPQIRRRIIRRGDPRDDWARIVPRYLLITVVLLLAMVLAFGISDLPHYRVYFLFAPLMPYLVWRVDRTGYRPRQLRWLLILLATVFVMVVQLRVQQIYVGPAYCKTCRLQAPYPEIAAGLVAAGYQGGGLILADDEYVAGNMRVQFPAARVLSARYPLFRPALPEAPGACILVWNSDAYYRMPNRLRGMANALLGLDLSGRERTRRITAVVPHSDTAIAPRREITIAFHIVHGANGRCL